MPRQARPLLCARRVRLSNLRLLRRWQWHRHVLLLCVYWKRWCFRCNQSHPLVRSKVSNLRSRRFAMSFIARRIWRHVLRRLVASFLQSRLQSILSRRLHIWTGRRCRLQLAAYLPRYVIWLRHRGCRFRSPVPESMHLHRPLVCRCMSRLLLNRLGCHPWH